MNALLDFMLLVLALGAGWLGLVLAALTRGATPQRPAGRAASRRPVVNVQAVDSEP